MPELHPSPRAAVLMLLLAATGTCAGAADLDASGLWSLRMSAPTPVAGDCEVMDDTGYTETVRIAQDDERYTFAVVSGMVEEGRIEGGAYRHATVQEGLLPSGVLFRVRASSVFQLTSADALEGHTELLLDYDDGGSCRLDVEFSGERAPEPAPSGT